MVQQHQCRARTAPKFLNRKLPIHSISGTTRLWAGRVVCSPPATVSAGQAPSRRKTIIASTAMAPQWRGSPSAGTVTVGNNIGVTPATATSQGFSECRIVCILAREFQLQRDCLELPDWRWRQSFLHGYGAAYGFATGHDLCLRTGYGEWRRPGSLQPAHREYPPGKRWRGLGCGRL